MALDGRLEKLSGMALSLEQALATLGLGVEYLNQELDLKLESVSQLTAETLACNQWVAIWDTLCLRVNLVDFKYDYELHRSTIWGALVLGTFELPLNRYVRQVLWHVWLDRREEASFYAKFPFWPRMQCHWIRARTYFAIISKRVTKLRLRRKLKAIRRRKMKCLST